MVLCQCYSDPLTLSDPRVGLQTSPCYFWSLLNMFTSQSFWARLNSVRTVKSYGAGGNTSSARRAAHPHPYHFCVRWVEADSVWAAETVPPSHGSLLRSGGSATAGSISHSRPLLLAAPERLVAPSCLGSAGWNWAGSQESFGSINCPFG